MICTTPKEWEDAYLEDLARWEIEGGPFRLEESVVMEPCTADCAEDDDDPEA